MCFNVKKKSVNVLKFHFLLAASLNIVGCYAPGSIFPGMQNINTYEMRKQIKKERFHVKPTLIPITPPLISDQRVNTYFYRVSASDVLHVYVWQHPEFAMEVQTSVGSIGTHGGSGTSGYLVDSNGRIFFPLIGYVHVAGKTLDEIRILVTQKLKKYIPNPQVNVRVAEFRGQRVYVLGEVNNKGFLPINDQQLSIAYALSLSGWIDAKYADPSNIYVIRGNYLNPEVFWLDARTPDKLLLAEHFSLQPNDILFVSSAPISRLNRTLDQLLPIVQTVWFTQSVIKQS